MEDLINLVYTLCFCIYIHCHPQISFRSQPWNTLGTFKQRQENTSLATQTDGRFTQQRSYILPESHKHIVLLFFKQLLPRVILPTWQNYVFLDKSTGNLMTSLDLIMVVTLYRPSQPPNKLSIRGMSLVRESGASSQSILVSKHLPPGMLNFTYL